MKVRSNADALAADWTRRAEAAGPELRRATRAATFALLAEAKKNMREMIYDKPVPSVNDIRAERGQPPAEKGNKPAWRRTGNLRRSEKAALHGALGVVYNDARSDQGKRGRYAHKRHYMSCRFPAPWRDTAIKTVAPKIRKLYRAAILDAIRGGALPGPTSGGQ